MKTQFRHQQLLSFFTITILSSAICTQQLAQKGVCASLLHIALHEKTLSIRDIYVCPMKPQSKGGGEII